MANNKISNINNKPTIPIIANCTWYLYNFRKDLLDLLNKEGYNLILLSTIDKYSKYTNKYFSKINKLFLLRGSENLLFELITILNILYCCIRHRPNLIHNFTIKPCIYGSIVGRFIGTKKIFNHITGLGPTFFSNKIKRDILNKLLNPIYRYCFRNKKVINIFHNKSDRKTFIQKGLTLEKNTRIIEGSGVDTDLFKNDANKKKFNEEIQILFPARLIREKGIIELINACTKLWDENYKFILNIAGEIDIHNSSALSKKGFRKIINNKNIRFLGKSTQMVKVYKKMDIVVLPSWREGLSKSLLEAASMSLPIITTNVPGCKDIIKDEYSGLLVPVKDEINLSNAIKNFLDNQENAITFGKNARKIVLKKFTTNLINYQILKLYKSL